MYYNVMSSVDNGQSYQPTSFSGTADDCNAQLEFLRSSRDGNNNGETIFDMCLICSKA